MAAALGSVDHRLHGSIHPVKEHINVQPCAHPTDPDVDMPWGHLPHHHGESNLLTIVPA